MAGEALHPTLWRTCRVLANRSRLQMIQLLLRRPNLTVSQVAKVLSLSLATASQYLRALNARGLLTVKREGRYVRYRVEAGGDVGQTGPLLAALRKTFTTRRNAIEEVFRLCTAFTHPRRLAILQAIGKEGIPVQQIHRRVRMSRLAQARHLAKLQGRGFVTVACEQCRRRCPGGDLADTLLGLAEETS